MEFEVETWLLAHQFDTCIPTETKITARKSRTCENIYPQIPLASAANKRLPIFPGYVFTRFSARHDPWRYIWSAPGVKKLFSSDPQTPTRIRPEAMRVILELAEHPNKEIYHQPKPLFQPGQEVIPTQGAFESFHGIFLQSHANRAKVLMSIFGRNSEVEIDIKHLRPV
jgi:transcription antitermination factor NusG